MGLSANNLCIGNVLLRINECESTNIYAKQLLSKNEPIEGTVVITDKQSKGKGQFGNIWFANDYENLTFSIILKPHFLQPIEQFYISKMVSLACVQTLNTFYKKGFSIKWPNDIYFNNKKIGGILIENTISSKKIIDSVVGIGINVNQISFGNLENAISLKTIINKTIDLEELLFKILNKLDALYLMLRNKKFEVLNRMYLDNLFALNTRRYFILKENNQKFEAEIKGVKNDGKLHLLVNKENVLFTLKEIIWCF